MIRTNTIPLAAARHYASGQQTTVSQAIVGSRHPCPRCGVVADRRNSAALRRDCKSTMTREEYEAWIRPTGERTS